MKTPILEFTIIFSRTDSHRATLPYTVVSVSTATAAQALHFRRERRLQDKCGIGKVDTVDKALKRLCEVGLIEKHHQYTPNGGYKSNIYTIPDFGDVGNQ